MLITIEGIDGAGKTTLIKELKDRLKDLNPVCSFEPGSPDLLVAVRNAISNNTDPIIEATLFIADHAICTSKLIKPALSENRLVILDRYVDSRFAYQEVSLEGHISDPHKWLEDVHSGGWSIVPDKTFLLTLPIDVAMSRLDTRSEVEHFERKEFLEKVQEKYLARVSEDPKRFVIIDATLPILEIIDFVESSIRQLVTSTPKSNN
ncbi:MAG TPA: dTMP kinase [Methanocorpusculum sp.]|nr:dTMP kinase [Methanocorpusculum sp.]HJJ56097.1 dTMP kinase [Methanocorpusculum sp.]